MNISINRRLKVCSDIIVTLLTTRVLISVILLLLSSCSAAETSTKNPIRTTETIEIPTSALTITSTSVPTKVAPTLTPSPLENIINFQQFDIASEIPADLRPDDALVIWSEPLQLLRFEPDIHRETIIGIDPNAGCFSTSPDGKWLSYCPQSSDSPTGQWLIVESADRQEQKKVPMDLRLIYFGAYQWLDNQRLTFPLIQAEYQPAYPVVVINPFTGEQVKLSSDYPGLQLSPSGTATSMDFNFSDVVYDPLLEHVIFPSWGGEHNYIVLWNRQSNSEVARVENHSQVFGHYPLWSPDATQFAVPVVNTIRGDHVIEEWYSVSREGQVEQLTHFGDYFSDSDIGSASNWSPDGRKLAFWIEVSPSLCPGLNLALLDLDTKQITNTCIPGNSDYAPPPIWSLDSRYIVAVNANTSPRQTILVDIEEDRAFDITDITDGSIPIGWLVSP
jgi:hypothetical protein